MTLVDLQNHFSYHCLETKSMQRKHYY